MSRSYRWFAAFACTFCAAGVEPVIAQHFDVFVSDVGGRIGLGAADVDGAHFTIESLVFESELEKNLAKTAWEAHEPGFFGLSSSAAGLFPSGASALPAGADVAVVIEDFTIGLETGPLFFWDGYGQPIFALPAAGTNISVTPNAGKTTGANGELDYHPTFGIEGGGALSPAGIYLAAVRVSLPSSALGASDLQYIVLGTEGAGGAMDDAMLDEVIDAGVGWVERNLVVPEPTAFALAGVACCALFSRSLGRRM